MIALLSIIVLELFLIGVILFFGIGGVAGFLNDIEKKPIHYDLSQVKIGRKTLILYSHHEEVERFPVDKRLDYISAHTPRNEDEDLLAVSVGGKTYYGDEVEFI